MSTKIIQTKVIIAEGEDYFFKEVEFDFDANQINPSFGANTGIYMIENKTEKVDVNAYATDHNVVLFNAWITKNISYKLANGFKLPSHTGGSIVIAGQQDEHGITTVTGPILHMTKTIDFGGIIKVYLNDFDDCIRKDDKVEVLEAEVIGSADEFYKEEEITDIASLEPFTPPIYQYGKIKEKMCIRIKVKVVREEHLIVNAD